MGYVMSQQHAIECLLAANKNTKNSANYKVERLIKWLADNLWRMKTTFIFSDRKVINRTELGTYLPQPMVNDVEQKRSN